MVLWPDTFSNYFLPGTLKATVRVLESAGYRVIVPDARLCCGRPLYDYGMLALARTKLEQILDVLRPAIRAGIPVVAVEPSCLSVFRDEMPNLLAGDPDAQRLSRQSKTLAELLLSAEWRPPRLPGKAMLHMHCHQKSVLNAAAQLKLLEEMGLEIEQPSAACCGHAGAFGYEIEHYPLSMRIGEHSLLPKIRTAPQDTFVIADGFSCRQQIQDGAGRWAMHPAEVLALALEESSGRRPKARERLFWDQPAKLNPVVAWSSIILTLGVCALSYRVVAHRGGRAR